MTNPIQNTLNSINGLSLDSNATAQPKPGDELGQADCLRLMTAQLEAQDPLKPQESGEFLTQLAQFGTVNGIQELQKSFTGLSNSLQSLQALQASTLVGRTVLVDRNFAELSSGGAVTGQVDAGGANNIVVSYHNTSGALVHQQVVDSESDGFAPFSWNGVTSDGTSVSPGVYLVSAQGTVDGETVALGAQMEAAVDSVTLNNGGMGLSLNLAGGGSIDVGEVLEIK